MKDREELTPLEHEADKRGEEVCFKGMAKQSKMNGL